MVASLIQHRPFIGGKYNEGLEGQKIAIVGYSHWMHEADGADYPDLTNEILRYVIEDQKLPSSFFDQLLGYFRYAFPNLLAKGHAALWDRVIFFNYMPQCVGGPEERYDDMPNKLEEDANKRFKGVLKEYKPDKVLVFSAKAWDSPMPKFDKAWEQLNVDGLHGAIRPNPTGIYIAGGHEVLAFGLRHPQGAGQDRMSKAVDRIMAYRSKPNV